MLNYIYVVFSATPYKMGKLIRKVTGSTYNHMSISLDSELNRMYSFARRYYRTPLYGGFVRESLNRYQKNAARSQIMICRIPVTTARYAALEQHLSLMETRQNRYLYNHLSALSSLLRVSIPARDASTCVEFCVQCLHTAGFPVIPGHYYSIPQLAALLQPYTVYRGIAPDPKDQDSTFYKKVPHSVFATLRDMLRLANRIGK